MFSRFCRLTFTKHVARPKACYGRQLFTQSASKHSLANTCLVACTGIVVSSFVGTCYVYYTNDGLRRSIQSGYVLDFSMVCTPIGEAFNPGMCQALAWYALQCLKVDHCMHPRENLQHCELRRQDIFEGVKPVL